MLVNNPVKFYQDTLTSSQVKFVTERKTDRKTDRWTDRQPGQKQIMSPTLKGERRTSIQEINLINVSRWCPIKLDF